MAGFLQRGYNSPKTTLGAVVILAVLAMLWCHRIDTAGAVTVMGLGGAWIGVNAQDSKPK